MSHRGADHEVCLGWGSHADVVRQRLEQLAAPLLVSKGTGRQRYMQRYLEEKCREPRLRRRSWCRKTAGILPRKKVG